MKIALTPQTLAVLLWLTNCQVNTAHAAEQYRTTLPATSTATAAMVLTSAPLQTVALPATITTTPTEIALESELPRGTRLTLPFAVLADGSIVTRPAETLATSAIAAAEREIAELNLEIATLSEKLTALQQRRAALPTQGENR